MSGSRIFYKFRSESAYSTLTFDGPSLSVFDVKREIAAAKKLKGDFDLAIFNAATNQGAFLTGRGGLAAVWRKKERRYGTGPASKYPRQDPILYAPRSFAFICIVGRWTWLILDKVEVTKVYARRGLLALICLNCWIFANLIFARLACFHFRILRSLGLRS